MASSTSTCRSHTVWQAGTKTPSIVAFTASGRRVPTRFRAAFVEAAQRGGDAVLDVLRQCEASEEWNTPTRGRSAVRIRHRRVALLAEVDTQPHAVAVCTVEADPASAEAHPVVVFKAQDSLLNEDVRPRLRACHRASPLPRVRLAPRATYKWNGENWLVRASGDGGRPTRFSFYRRSDRKPRGLVAELRNNVVNVQPPACLAAGGAPMGQLARSDDEHGVSCTHCGPLANSREGLVAHMLYDAVVAAKSGKAEAFDAFVRAYTAEESVAKACGEAGTLAAEDSRALPFLCEPFNASVFRFRGVARCGGKGKKGGKRSKGGRRGRKPGLDLSRRFSEQVVSRAATEVWAYLARCGVSVTGKVSLQLTDDDFLAPDAVRWDPCHAKPDPVSLHWPGYAYLGVLQLRQPCAGVPPSVDAFESIGELTATSVGHMATRGGRSAPAASARATSTGGAGGAGAGLGDAPSAVQDAAAAWQLSLVVSRLRLPGRSSSKDRAKWAAMTEGRCTKWCTGVGEVPAHWLPVLADSVSGLRDTGVHVSEADAYVAAFEIPVEEVARHRLLPDMPLHAIGAVRTVGASWGQYFAWLQAFGTDEAWVDGVGGEALAVEWQHSFEMIGSDFQHNPEGLPAGINVLVPHGWHPRGDSWLNDTIVSAGLSPTNPFTGWSYFDFARLLAHDAEGAVVKEGLVLHVPLPTTAAVEDPDEDAVAGMVVKVRRDDFFGDAAASPKSMSAHELLRIKPVD